MPASMVPKVILGETGIESSRLGLGMAGWPEGKPLDRVAEVLRAAFSIGVRHLDNAAKYNTEGIIGRALEEVDVPADTVFCTKVCVYWDPELGIPYQSFSQTGILRSIERSLRLLGRESLDIVYIHDAQPVNIPVVFDEKGPLTVLEDLRRQGVVKAVGMATRYVPTLTAAVESGRVDLVQTFHINTLLNREAHDTIYPLAMERGIPVMDSGPYGGYILATGPREGAEYGYMPAGENVMAAAGRLQETCRVKGVKLPDAAVAFALRHPAVKTVTIGSGNPDHVRGWVRALDLPLTDSDYADLLEAAGPSIGREYSIFTRNVVTDFVR